jgi:hypothetical protein
MARTIIDTPAAAAERTTPTWRHLSLALLAIGLVLRIVAYAGNPPLWLDEILLSRNIIDLPLGALLIEPLGLDQVAPRGFLLIERLAVLAFGPNELALRVFPFLCGIATLILFRRLAEAMLAGPAVPIAVGLVALGVPFLKFGAEVKQYIVDAGAATLLMLIAVRLRREDSSTGRLISAGVIGFVVSWFSQTSAMVMAAIGLAFAVTWMMERDRRAWRVLLFTIPIWAVASALALVLGTMSMTPSTREFMQTFWATGFFPLPFDGWRDILWFWNSGLTVFSEPTLLRYRWPTLFVLLALTGVASLWRRDRFAALLVLCPVMIVMAAAVAQQYPFLGRLLMFVVPSTLLAITAGIDAVRRLAMRLHPAAGVLAVAACLTSPVLALVEAPPPYRIDRTREALAYLQQHRQPGDVVYVWPISKVPVVHYGADAGITPDMWITAPCHRDDVRGYLRDLDRFRGTRRFWTLGMDARVFRPARASVARYLDAIGHKRDALVLPSMSFGRVTLELYDLSDEAKLRMADAETFPVDRFNPLARPGCRDWARPDTAVTVR